MIHSIEDFQEIIPRTPIVTMTLLCLSNGNFSNGGRFVIIIFQKLMMMQPDAALSRLLPLFVVRGFSLPLYYWNDIVE